MVDVDKAVIARLKSHGKKFEILVDCDKAIELKQGKNVNLNDVLATDAIFTDVKKGNKAPEKELEDSFGTSDALEISEEIIKKGEVQLTQDHMNKLREEKRKQIINLIHKNGVDSKTNLPHPPQRIENALEEVRISVDPFRPAEEQIKDILVKIRPILPIRFEKRKVEVKIPSQFASKGYSTIKKFSNIIDEKWQNDGSWLGSVEIPAGVQEEFFSELNSITHGKVETKVLQVEGK